MVGGAAAADDGVAPPRELQRERAAQPPADPRDEHRPRPRRRRPRRCHAAAAALGPRRHLLLSSCAWRRRLRVFSLLSWAGIPAHVRPGYVRSDPARPIHPPPPLCHTSRLSPLRRLVAWFWGSRTFSIPPPPLRLRLRPPPLRSPPARRR